MKFPLSRCGASSPTPGGRHTAPSSVQAQAGDLVFYKGVYTAPGKAQQKLGMVHVEMLLPGSTGRGTIGSRWNQQCVTRYDDFAFETAAWGDVEVFIR